MSSDDEATVTSTFYALARASTCSAKVAIYDLTTDGHVLTYVELAARVQGFAKRLARRGVSPGSCVPLIATRGKETVVGVLAILSCGAYYVPISPAAISSTAALRRVVKAFSAKVFVLASEARDMASYCVKDVTFVTLDDECGSEAKVHRHLLDRASLSGRAYSLLLPGACPSDRYTQAAGMLEHSTHKTRAASASHADLARSSRVVRDRLTIKPGRLVGQVFDIATESAACTIFACLTCGGTLVIRGRKWRSTLEQINVLLCTPAILCRIAPERYPQINTVAVTGATVPKNLANLWAKYATFWHCKLSLSTATVQTMEQHVAFGTTVPLRAARHRVDPVAVSAHLQDDPQVLYAVTIRVRSDLYSFVVPAGVDTHRLELRLRHALPADLVPVAVHALEELPVTAHGAADTAALRSAISGNAKSPQADEIRFPVAPTTELGRNSRLRKALVRQMSVFPIPSAVATLINLALLLSAASTEADKGFIYSSAVANFVVSTLVHQDIAVNALYWTIFRIPRSIMPIWVRHQCAGVHDRGVFHSSVGIWAYVWLVWFAVEQTVGSGQGNASRVVQISSWNLFSAYSLLVIFTKPLFPRGRRIPYIVHRSIGWAIFALFWCTTLLLANEPASAGLYMWLALAKSPAFWMLTLPSVFVLFTWAIVRSITVSYKSPDGSAVFQCFPGYIPPAGTWMHVSDNPWQSWCRVPTIPVIQPSSVATGPGYSVLVCGGSAWGRKCIDERPRQVWVRGFPVYGLMATACLFEHVTLVATGSGIVPMLGFLRLPSTIFRLIWSIDKEAETLGEGIVALVEQCTDPIMHNTALAGESDLVQLVREEVADFESEAIFMVGNAESVSLVSKGMSSTGVSLYSHIYV